MLRVLKAQEVANILDCEEKTINLRATTGDLPGMKLGRGWVFPVDALEARLNEIALAEAAKRRAPRAVAPAPQKSRFKSAPSLA